MQAVDRDPTVVEGQGLHSAAPAVVRFERRAGPTAIRARGREVAIAELRVVPQARSTALVSADGALGVGTVEHLFAALAAAGAREGVVVEVEGPEIPLADGGARVFLDALMALGVAPSAPSLVVACDGVIEVGESRYEFLRHDGVALEVSIDFGDARLAPVARWDGDLEDFRARIATARTFGFEREVLSLLEHGLASHVSRESVVVLGDDRVLSAGRPFSADEPARHKLLDLTGDLFAHGGPPVGRVRATRPGHAATHEAVRRALGRGLLRV